MDDITRQALFYMLANGWQWRDAAIDTGGSLGICLCKGEFKYVILDPTQISINDLLSLNRAYGHHCGTKGLPLWD